jgi:hypothetical protein
MKVERACKLVGKDGEQAQWQVLQNARRRGLVAFGSLAPLTAVAGPLLAVPMLGTLGWLLTGLGVLLCVALLFYVARLDADMSAYGPVHALSRKRAVPAAPAHQPAVVYPFPDRDARQPARAAKLKALDGIRRRPYRLAH